MWMSSKAQEFADTDTKCRKNGKPPQAKGAQRRTKIENTVPETMRCTAQERGIRKAQEKRKRATLEAISEDEPELSNVQPRAADADDEEASAAAPCQGADDPGAASTSAPPATLAVPLPGMMAHSEPQPSLTEAALAGFDALRKRSAAAGPLSGETEQKRSREHTSEQAADHDSL